VHVEVEVDRLHLVFDTGLSLKLKYKVCATVEETSDAKRRNQ